MSDLLGATATRIAAAVRAGEATATDVVRVHLERIGRLDPKVGAFQLVRTQRALEEAAAVQRRDDLASLPLAGVPVAIKDNIAVAGEPLRNGSRASSEAPSDDDDEIVRRLRAAGAVVVGKTRVPELCVYAWTDGAFGTARNPWDLTRTPGGSSGGSAAAVSAGMVPLAHGSDGGGSIRIPAAACGLFGIKPGSGVIPGRPGSSGWNGLSSSGPLGTTVEDTALALAVMAARPELATVAEPARRLRVAISVKPPFRVAVDAGFAAAARRFAGLLAQAGHDVVEADPPYDLRALGAVSARALGGIAEEASALDFARLERRNRLTVRAGRVVNRLGLVRERGRRRWRDRTTAFFATADVLITPTLAAPPIVADGWWERSAVANMRVAGFAPFTNMWNLAGYPAASVPAGVHPAGTPLAVQVVAPDGGEALVLSVAKQLERLAPWRRHAPLADGGA